MGATVGATSILLSVAIGASGCGSSSSSTESSAATPAATAASSAGSSSLASLVPADIRKKGSLSYASEFSYAPYDIKNSAGDYDGGEVQIVQAVAKQLDLKLTYTNLAFSALVPAIGQSRFDFAGNQVGVTDARRKVVSYVTYGTTGSTLIVRKGNPTGLTLNDLCGRTVSTETGTITIDQMKEKSKECTDAGKKPVTVHVYSTAAAGILGVQSGKDEANIGPSTTAASAASQSGGKLESLQDLIPGTEFDIGFIFNPKDTELAKAFLAAMQELDKNGELAAINDKWQLVHAIKIGYLPSTG